MCIVLISTAHPEYPLILINNRDEYLSRPTAPADFWAAPEQHVLGGRDLQRTAQGTWLGVTRDGRIAVLTNFHEPDAQAAAGRVSRGVMVKAFLAPATAPEPPAFVEQLVAGAGARGVGGFSLVCGRVGHDLAVVSNRMASPAEIQWIARAGDTVALSNAAYGDRSWPKVTDGERLLRELVEEAAATASLAQDQLVDRLFTLLDRDTMPPSKPTDTFDQRMAHLRKTIFVPPIHRTAAVPPDAPRATETDAAANGKPAPEPTVQDGYATQKQTVVLVDRHRSITYIEKTLFHGLQKNDVPVVRQFEFQLPPS